MARVSFEQPPPSVNLLNESEVNLGKTSSQILVKIRMVRARNVVCGLRKGDEIPTLCYLWVMPLRCFKCVRVNKRIKTHYIELSQTRVFPILYAMCHVPLVYSTRQQ